MLYWLLLAVAVAAGALLRTPVLIFISGFLALIPIAIALYFKTVEADAVDRRVIVFTIAKLICGLILALWIGSAAHSLFFGRGNPPAVSFF